MNYQRAIAAAIRQIRFRSVAVDADATATAVSVAGSGFSSFCPAAVAATTAADAAAANILISEGPFYTDPYNLYRFYSGTCLRRA